MGPIGPAGRRPLQIQMPLRGNRFRMTTSPRVTLGLWQWPWLVARKSLPLCLNRLWSNLTSGTPSHSCPFWQPSCTSRRSAPDGPKRLGTAPTHKAVGRDFFCGLQDRGGLPSATGELRSFHEFVATKPHLIPRRPATCAHLFPTGCITVDGGQVYQFFAFFAVFRNADAFFIHLAQPILGHGGFDVEFAALQGLFKVMAGFGVIPCDAASQKIEHPQHGLGFWQALFGGFGVPKGSFFIFFVTVKIGIA